VKRLHQNWLVRGVLFVAGIFSLRLVSTMLHVTTLEKLYKPRDFRKTSHVEISEEIISRLPNYCQTIFGRKMDPINLIFIGTEAGLKRAFEKAGWSGAHPPTPIHGAAALISSIFNKTYRQGPFMPLFISIGLQDLAFQKIIKKGYGQRHHIRIWRTRHELPEGNRVWVAAATFEKSFKPSLKPPFIYHHMEPKLDVERDFIASFLVEEGHLAAGEYKINEPLSRQHPGYNPHGDAYYTDGKAKAIEIV
jgi:hypothetical protein